METLILCSRYSCRNLPYVAQYTMYYNRVVFRVCYLQPYLQSWHWDIDCSMPRHPIAWTNICRFHFRRQYAMSILSHAWSSLNNLLIWSSQFRAVSSSDHTLFYSLYNRLWSTLNKTIPENEGIMQINPTYNNALWRIAPSHFLWLSVFSDREHFKSQNNESSNIIHSLSPTFLKPNPAALSRHLDIFQLNISTLCNCCGNKSLHMTWMSKWKQCKRLRD